MPQVPCQHRQTEKRPKTEHFHWNRAIRDTLVRDEGGRVLLSEEHSNQRNVSPCHEPIQDQVVLISSWHCLIAGLLYSSQQSQLVELVLCCPHARHCLVHGEIRQSGCVHLAPLPSAGGRGGGRGEGTSWTPVQPLRLAVRPDAVPSQQVWNHPFPLQKSQRKTGTEAVNATKFHCCSSPLYDPPGVGFSEESLKQDVPGHPPASPEWGLGFSLHKF